MTAAFLRVNDYALDVCLLWGVIASLQTVRGCGVIVDGVTCACSLGGAPLGESRWVGISDGVSYISGCTICPFGCSMGG